MKRSGPWSANQTTEFLEETRVPIRVACNAASGHPMLASLWFVPLAGELWCATQQSASLVSVLRRDPRCAFEISVEKPPYLGVRGRGIASLRDDRGEEILRTLLDRYQGGSTSKLARTLLAKVEDETAISIVPQTLVSWDFRERMR